MSREILKNIIDEFDPEKFIRFFRDKNRDFKPRTEELNGYNDDSYSNCIRLGKIDFPGGANMIVCSLNTDKSLTERSGKKSQYEKGKKILKDTQSDSGIFIYYDNAGNFRFSLIYANYLGNKRDWSTFKRFTYFVSKEFTNKTFIQRIGDSDFSSLENIKDAFSVEKVNKEFYKEIAIKFSELVGGQRVIKSKVEKFRPLIKLPGTNDHQKLQEFAVRMIGRIVFCWFLKKKKSQNGIPLIPENLLSVSAVEKNKNYYHSVLEKLFFEILNTKQEERKKFKGFELYKDIPFLNGGLFEPQDDDLYKPSLINSLIIPDKWLAEFFNILESYNFTIDENTSIDVELSIDPEMLGRIFENLLAEINPETGESARKSTGSYYTPRPIVEYMVDESLKQYLITKTDIPESKLSMLLSYSSEEAEITDKESVKIINALDEIKILDPACGSGAFPIGILQKMLLILQKIDKKSSKWLEKKLNKIESSVLRKELKEKFKNENLDYIRKLGLIQDSIYGVDIQSIAVEISKLRCFLTLIVDEDVDDKKPNRGIIPLPNLEFKFVAANTLISLPEEEGSLFDESEYIKQLEGLRDEFFTSYGQDKLEIESDFITIQEKMVKKLLRNGITGGRAFELAGWIPFFNEKADWFDPKWMFGIEDGFDIVIGNPPYVESKKLKHVSQILRKFYSTYSGTADLYVYFYENGIKLLRDEGILVFITSNKFIKTSYGENLRKYFLDFMINEIIDFTDVHVFDALVASCIFSITKKRIAENKIKIAFANDMLIQFPSILTFVQQNKFYLPQSGLSEKIWQLENETRLALKVKIENDSITLNETGTVKIFRGVTTGYNPAFIIDDEKRRDLIDQDKVNKNIIKPMLQGRNIRKWVYNKTSNFLIFTRRGIDIKKFPSIKKHLNSFKQQLDPGIGRKPGSYNWYEIQDNTAYYNEFEKEKIIWGLTADKWAFAYDNEKNYLPSNGYILTSSEIQIKYLLALLNSKLMECYFGFIGIMTAGGAYTLKYETVIEFPIKNINSKEQQPFIIIVDQIINLKSQNKDTSELENQIDVMVYKIYELTYDEVKIVDPEFWMSKGEYEKLEIK